MDILSIESGTISYKVERKKINALDNVDIVFEEHSNVAIIGESGAGKTTMLRVLAGITRLNYGEVKFRGQNINHLKRQSYFNYRKNVQYIFQDPYDIISPKQSIESFLEVPLRFLLHIKSKSEIKKMSEDALESVGLSSDLINRYPHELSGGQRQRVAIARALLSSPSVLLADEPTSMLDASAVVGILNIFKKLNKEMNISIILITHNISVAAYVADKIYVMFKGRVIEFASKEALLAHQYHPYTKLLIDTVKSTSILDLNKEYQKISSCGCMYYEFCHRRKDVCITEVPALKKVDENHWVACYNIE